MEWVEAQGKSVEDAVQAALAELQLASREDASIEVLQEPKAGFLGMGTQDAVVKVTPKPRPKRRRRRSRNQANQQSSDGRGSQSTSGQGKSGQGKSGQGKSGQGKSGQGKSGQGKSGQNKKSQPNNRSKGKQSQSNRTKNGKQSQTGSQQSDRGKSSTKSAERGAKAASSAPKESTVEEESERSVTVEEQAEVAAEFLNGLLEAFGLEGEVTTKVDDDVLYLDVSGDQTEALVGAKGAIMQSVLELTRTVIQRKTYGAPRMRIDIAGYAERRREALKIYTAKLVEKVLADKGEVMLEPMNPADRKVIHDAVAEHDGVRSFSEGEDPHRSVVIAAVS